MKIIIASSNPNKITEILSILNTPDNKQFDYSTIQNMQIQEPDEPYSTFIENACHKAKYYSGILKSATLSEDAGLCIDALSGFPGVKTKDLVFETGSLNNAYIELQRLLVEQTNLSAQFICAAALYIPDQDLMLSFEGVEHGQISFPPRGANGFGFDPIFVPDGYRQTMAELGAKVKNKIGHRALAMQGIAKLLQDL